MSAYALPGFSPLPGNCSFSAGALTHAPAHETASRNDYCNLDKEEKDEYADNTYCQQQEPTVGIAVKEAKIDAARLIQALTKGTSTQTRQQAAAASSESNNLGRLRRRGQSQTAATPQEEAMQFELSISFNGRKYTAVRTLPSILKLRRDLVEEVQDRHRTRVVQATFSTGVSIPELPRPAPDGAGNGTACRGFTMLHNLLRSYAPSLEGWLRNVTTLVPPHDSPSWTNFLWEPVSIPTRTVLDSIMVASNSTGSLSSSTAAATNLKANHPLQRRGASMPCLAKIEESEHDDEEDCGW